MEWLNYKDLLQPHPITHNTKLLADGANSQWLKAFVNVLYFVFYANKDWIKEWLFGANIVGMVGMPFNIRNGSRKISIVHMDVSINAFKFKISHDFITTIN